MIEPAWPCSYRLLCVISRLEDLLLLQSYGLSAWLAGVQRDENALHQSMAVPTSI